MKYFQSSALTGDNVEKMFFTIIEDIIELQQIKRKKVLEEDLAGPQTVENLVSARKQAIESERKQENGTVQLDGQTEENGRKYCC